MNEGSENSRMYLQSVLSTNNHSRPSEIIRTRVMIGQIAVKITSTLSAPTVTTGTPQCEKATTKDECAEDRRRHLHAARTPRDHYRPTVSSRTRWRKTQTTTESTGSLSVRPVTTVIAPLLEDVHEG